MSVNSQSSGKQRRKEAMKKKLQLQPKAHRKSGSSRSSPSPAGSPLKKPSSSDSDTATSDSAYDHYDFAAISAMAATPDEELDVWPNRINFLEPWTEGNAGQTQKVKLTNRCFRKRVVFRILITSPEMYVVKPIKGFISKGKSIDIMIQVKRLTKVVTLQDQGIQFETLYWFGKKCDEEEKRMAYAHFKQQRSPHGIYQRLRIHFPPDIAFQVPKKHKLVDEDDDDDDDSSSS